jgi:arylformamidase
MKYYDISVPISPETITWADDHPPIINRERSIEQGDYVNLSSLQMNIHTGTHVDAPSHFIHKGKTINQMDLSPFMGEAWVVETDVMDISYQVLAEKQIAPTERILLKTGGSSLYKKNKFCSDFPALVECGARWMVEKQIKLVGIEYLSIEHYGSRPHTIHQILLEGNIAILEGLNLEGIKPGKYQLMALPLNLIGTEGAPVRALLFPPDY